jgi:hypothetical protein
LNDSWVESRDAEGFELGKLIPPANIAAEIRNEKTGVPDLIKPLVRKMASPEYLRYKGWMRRAKSTSPSTVRAEIVRTMRCVQEQFEAFSLGNDIRRQADIRTLRNADSL